MRRGTWALCLLLWVTSCSHTAPLTPVRIGYSSQTAIHVQLGQILEKTGILAANGLQGTLVATRKGDEQSRLMQEGKLDVVFLCDVPTIQNLLQHPHLKLFATPGPLGMVRLLVGKDSPLHEISELKGRSIGVKRGSLCHRFLLDWLGKDVKIVELEGNPADFLASRRADAIVVNDPQAAELVVSGQARAVAEAPYYSQVGVTADFAEKNPQAVKALRRSLQDALSYLGKNRQQANEWAASQSGYSVQSLELAALANPFYRQNLEAIDVSLKGADLEVLDACARFVLDQTHAPQALDVRSRIITD